MTTEIDEMFAAYRRKNEERARQESGDGLRPQKGGRSRYGRQVTACRLALAADTALAGVLAWLLTTHAADGLDVASLAATGALIGIHAATVTRRLAGLTKHNPATARPNEMLRFSIETEARRNRPTTVLSSKVSIAAATAALIAISVTPVYEGRTMSAARLGDRAEVIENIDTMLEGHGVDIV